MADSLGACAEVVVSATAGEDLPQLGDHATPWVIINGRKVRFMHQEPSEAQAKIQKALIIDILYRAVLRRQKPTQETP